MRSFLARRDIPAVLRTQTILSVLVVLATCGCELHGYSQGFSLIDCVIRPHDLRYPRYFFSSFRKKAGEDLRIPSMSIRRAELRARAITKLVNIRSLIRILIVSPYKYRADPGWQGSRSAENTSTHWHSVSYPKAVFPIASAMTTRLTATNEAHQSNQTDPWTWDSSPIWKPILKSPGKMAGVHMLLLMRVGAFYPACRLATADMIYRSYLTACRFYMKYVCEDLKKILSFAQGGTIRNTYYWAISYHI